MENVENEEDLIPLAFIGSKEIHRDRRKYLHVPRQGDVYKQDMAWIQKDWSSYSSSEWCLSADTSGSVKNTASEVSRIVAESWLSRMFRFAPGIAGMGGEFDLREVLSFLAGTARLNDVVMYCALQKFCAKIAKCFAVDPEHKSTLVC
ncbi:hypothetical protein PHYSODRAFT_306148 [Phytophthora sojae]|uniref:Uncharacterized protein n=1 Tax=Phytophthora sojae (strain P6497) TaxID=1094619 RepID=G5A827_PHYSP|nr:hypothetical protein PHYSODRAFT_306148 [Phytophthora sojae]EGZ08053.1 hypothetical protein PHYSODRAFT_306148 [Phytophthora sojae]|eukprot:XP_009536225.1 hypothetical protein PHYSODRAFT_306148 [Phytophthora sojae]